MLLYYMPFWAGDQSLSPHHTPLKQITSPLGFGRSISGSGVKNGGRGLRRGAADLDLARAISQLYSRRPLRIVPGDILL
jgi:hypothetical protein